MAAVALENVSKIFANGHAALRDLTIAAVDGELLVLVGPSGSGKSTVLRLVAGLDAPTAGRILIGGVDVTELQPQARDVAMVFQSYALYPHKSVRENLAFGLRMRRVPSARIDERVRSTAAMLGIGDLLDRRPAQLSGGQRQRVALGRAIVREPKAFLLDEPLSNLDPLLRVDTRAELALLHRRLGATMIYVTHDQEEAMTLGTRIAVMRDGRLEQLAPPLEVFRRPANVFVARFVGSPAMNLWPAASIGIDGWMAASAPAAGRSLLIGVRPHDLELAAEEGGDLSGRIEIVEPLGASTLVHVKVEALPRELVRVVAPADVSVAPGANVDLRVRRDRVHFFDETTGQRIPYPQD